MWSRNTVSSHIPFFCGGDPLCVFARRPENAHGELTGLLEWLAGLPLSPKLQTLYCFPIPTRKYEHASSPTYFLFMAGYRNLHTSVFVFCLVNCWSYLRTEISITLSTSNKSHSSPSSFIFLFPVKPLCWSYLATALNLLSSSTALRRQLSQYITLIAFFYHSLSKE